MNAYEQCFEKVVGIEGGFSDHPSDRGGQTKYGITEKTARANGYVGDMKDMPIEQARAIYKMQYWNTLRLDDIAGLSLRVAAELFDTAINMGVGTSGQFLQRALNALNRQAADYADMVVDGVVGPMTVNAFKAFMYRRRTEGETVMLAALNALQGERYIRIAEGDREQEAFVFGWLLNRVAVA